MLKKKNAKNKKRKKSLENGNNQFQPPCATISVQYSIKKVSIALRNKSRGCPLLYFYFVINNYFETLPSVQ